MIKRIILAIYITLLFTPAFSQGIDNGIVQGKVINSKNNEPVPFANIIIYNTNKGLASNFDGDFILTDIKPGFIKLKVSAVGFETYVSPEIMVTNARKVNFDIPLNETSFSIDEVVVKPSVFRKTEESPLSMRVIGIQEIEKSPGSNRDISKVIQSFPGVASTHSRQAKLLTDLQYVKI